MPPKRTLTFILPRLLILVLEAYLQLLLRLTVLADCVLRPLLNTILTFPLQISEIRSAVQYLGSCTPGGHLSGMQLRVRAFGAQNLRGKRTAPVVLNLYGALLSRLGATLDDVEEEVFSD